MRKRFFVPICKNKDADQLRSNREADQRLCYCFLNPKLQASRHTVAAQSDLCWTWWETPRTGFLTTRLKYISFQMLNIFKICFSEIFYAKFLFRRWSVL